jgi:hypothetical protein
MDIANVIHHFILPIYFVLETIQLYSVSNAYCREYIFSILYEYYKIGTYPMPWSSYVMMNVCDDEI